MPRKPSPVVMAFLLLLSVTGCPRGPATTPPVDPVAAPADGKVEAAGLHNVYRLSEKLYSGNSPDGEEGFRSLQGLGIRTVVSVDGARPDVETAHKYGLRYVHVPVGYDGISREQALRLAKAARDLPGPLYFHCHHGQHRGPAAAAVAHLALDEECTVEMAVAEMRRAGTDPHYTGLYAAPAAFPHLRGQDLAGVPADFPEVAPVQGLASLMVGIDERWDRIKQMRAAGWKTPPGQPDLDPPHEALQLVEQFSEARRLTEGEQRPEAFQRLLADAVEAGKELEAALRSGRKREEASTPAAEKAFSKVNAGCVHCHMLFRDVPK